jgi:hypothetical protein
LAGTRTRRRIVPTQPHPATPHPTNATRQNGFGGVDMAVRGAAGNPRPPLGRPQSRSPRHSALTVAPTVVSIAAAPAGREPRGRRCRCATINAGLDNLCAPPSKAALRLFNTALHDCTFGARRAPRNPTPHAEHILRSPCVRSCAGAKFAAADAGPLLDHVGCHHWPQYAVALPAARHDLRGVRPTPPSRPPKLTLPHHFFRPRNQRARS